MKNRDLQIGYGGSPDEFKNLLKEHDVPEDRKHGYETAHKWNEKQLEKDAKYPERVFELFQKEGMFPENMEGFTFVSVSANKAFLEKGLAISLDKTLAGQNFDIKPKFIAADFAGSYRDGKFHSIFDGVEKPELENVEFVFQVADARTIELPEESVNILWDRLGAVWNIGKHDDDGLESGEELSEEKFKKTVIELLDRFSGFIKKVGHIVLDAHITDEDDVPMSTAWKIEQNFGDTFEQALAEIGLSSRFVGEGKDRLLLIEKNTNV